MVAYQSGDESEGNESDQSDSENSDHSETESNTSKKSSDFEILDVDEDNRAAVKRHRASNEQTDEDQIEETESPPLMDITLERMSNSGSPLISQNANENEFMETDKEVITNENNSNDSNYSEQPLPTDMLTLEKGFPPGCKDIKLPSSPKAECSQTLQVNICLFNHLLIQ